MFTYDQIRCCIHNLLSHISITGEIVHPCCLEHRVGQKMNQSVSRVCQNDIVVNQASNGFAIKGKSCLLTLQERVTQKNTFQAYSTYPMKCSLSAVSGYECLHSKQNTMTILNFWFQLGLGLVPVSYWHIGFVWIYWSPAITYNGLSPELACHTWQYHNQQACHTQLHLWQLQAYHIILYTVCHKWPRSRLPSFHPLLIMFCHHINIDQVWCLLWSCSPTNHHVAGKRPEQLRGSNSDASKIEQTWSNKSTQKKR